jgi:hypothetical protein
MPSAYDVYEFYLAAADLANRNHTVQIESVSKKQIFDPKLKTQVPHLALRLVGKKKTLLLNKTQVAAVIDITGTDDFDKWPTAFLVIAPGQSANHKATIEITKPAPTTPPA